MQAAISGYATLDYVMNAAATPAAGGTVRAEVVAGAWPRAGGAPLYAGAQLAGTGFDAVPLAAVGEDGNGAAYLAACAAAGLDQRGIARSAEARTPCCVLIHDAGGGYRCFLDPGAVPQRLLPAQVSALREAALVCVSAAPAGVTRDVLDLVDERQRLAWIVKADAACFPLELRFRLLSRADMVFSNVHEACFVDIAHSAARPGRILVTSAGTEPVVVEQDGRRLETAVQQAATPDSTGAGDTLAGAFMAAQLSGLSPDESARRAVEATGVFLRDRAEAQAGG